ncbi:MAG: polysaccharide biosynthesis tyrosine autokinase [Acidobacteriota bacterium]|nr:MAG: polysaccharide biosynthesis tyrosine autokinase [Acidobacteriota bacterium]
MQESRDITKNLPADNLELERPFDYRPAVPGQYPSYRGESAAADFRLLDYWRAIRKRLWLVIGLAALITTLTAIYMARKPNVYASRSVVQVDLEQVNPELVTSDRARPISNPDPAYFNTQLQLLRSDGLLRRVIKENNLENNKDFLSAKEESTGSALNSILRTLGLATSADGKTSSSTQLPSLDGLATTEEIEEAIKLAPFVDFIKRNLDVEPVRETRSSVRDTRLIDITFRHTSAEVAAFVSNAIAGTFTTLNQEKRSGTSRKTNDFLQERIANLQADVQRDEEKLVDLTQNAGILKTEGEQTIVIDRLSGLNKQLLEAENQRKNAEANYLAVANSPDKVNALAEEQSARFITEQENNIRVFRADILKKMADLRQLRASKLQEFQEGAPEIREIDAQLKSYEDSIDRAAAKFNADLAEYRKRTSKGMLENLRTKYLQAKSQEDKIRADFEKQYNEAQAQNQSAVNIKLLQQNIDTNKGFLDNLRKQVSGNDVAAQGSDNNISVIEIAIPSETAVSPRRLMTVSLALLLSTVFGMGLALFLEYLDDTIRSVEEIESYLQLPALAAIPTVDSLPKRKLLLVGSGEGEEAPPGSPLLISADPRSALAEAYRHLRTSILLSSAGHAPKMLLITSSLPAEGKTTTATNTAISLAQTGAKVLIIDADMRRPRLHSVFNMENKAGLSNLLANELSDAEVDAAILVDKTTRVHVMPSGPIPPNPAELIGSEQMALLLDMLRTKFTHVVLDSPPIASFTDGVLIASMVDGVILVVNAGVSSRQVVKKSRMLLNEIGAKVFGVVLNNVNLNTKDNYYYYQSYYHKGGYGQSDEA